ncbi:MAG: hypothetical protein HRU06_17960 [Oceanospirillaceae bacterium]|nr:hypothetical protein [Oceanospirillaceae bacterium]
MIRIGLLLLVVPCLMLMGMYLPEQSSIADCLEIGGSFDFQSASCDTLNTHPSSTFMARHTLLVNSAMLLALLGFFVCLIGLYRPKKVPEVR